jgi:dephospho-CoA kinase
MKTNILKIGITGGIGAGKTIVSQIFSILGAPVYNADERAKFILHHDAEVRHQVIRNFGDQSYKDEKLDTVFITREVFNHDDKLAKLNSFVHPKVKIDFEKWIREQHSAYILKEAALLYEAGSYKDLDKIITVFSPIELRIERVLTRDPKRTEASIRSIIQKQMSDDEKVLKADYVIYNDDTQLLIPQVIRLHKLFIAETLTGI